MLIEEQISRKTYINNGANVIHPLSEIRVDLCFLGTNGLSVAEGGTDSDWEVVVI